MSEYTHNFHNNILGEITFKRPYKFTFVYADGTREVFENVWTMQAMRTGCKVLFCEGGKFIVVPEGYRYYIEEPMKEAYGTA